MNHHAKLVIQALGILLLMSAVCCISESTQLIHYCLKSFSETSLEWFYGYILIAVVTLLSLCCIALFLVLGVCCLNCRSASRS